MRDKQSGMTMIGWLFVIAIIGVFALAAMRLLPVYMESMEVSSVLKSLQSEHDGHKPTVAVLRKSIAKRFQIKDIVSITPKEIVIKPSDFGYEVSATYERKSPFIGNLGLVVAVDHRVEIRR